jgi:Leucine-rich repeat (LRR) protein
MARQKWNTTNATLFFVAILFLGIAALVLFQPPIGTSTCYYSVEDALRSSTSAKKLALMNRNLLVVPVGIRKLKNLEYLVLDGNKISQLPNWLPQNEFIVDIYLGHNRFTVFPSELTQMVSLQQIRMPSNHIAEVPTSISNLKSLEGLDLRDNNISDLPDDIAKLTKLRWLRLGGNQIAPSNQVKIRHLLPHTDIDFGTQRP